MHHRSSRTHRFGRVLRHAALALAVASCLPVYSASAQEAAGEAVVSFDIPAGDLATALDRFSAQSGMQVLYRPELVTGKRVGALQGQRGWREAIGVLLRDSGLGWRMANERTIVIQRMEYPQPVEEPAMQSSGSAAGKDAITSMPAIMVKGARTLNTDIMRTRNDAQPYIVIDRRIIEESGAQNLEDLLKKRVTMSTGAVSANQLNTGLNTSSINLRGLGSDETLILINGRRTAGISTQGLISQADINSIPVAAVERIEILPTTASGIYGGGATGGVINIITQKSYTGMDVKLTHGNTYDGTAANYRIDVSGGFSFEEGRTNVSIFSSWSQAEALLTGDRSFAADARNHVLATNPSAILNSLPIVGATTNISSQNGGPLSFVGSNLELGSSRTYIPYGYSGLSSDGAAALIANAGLYNIDIPESAQNIGLGAQGARGALTNAPSLSSFFGSIRREFSSEVEAYFDVSLSENNGSFKRSGQLSFIRVPAGAPGNPFNEAIILRVPALGVDESSKAKLRTEGASTGIVIQLPREWSLNLDYTWTRTKSERLFGSNLWTVGVTEAITNGTINVFRDINEFPVDLSPYVLPPNQFTPSRTALMDIAVRMSGPLPFTLPGGAPTVSALAEHRKERTSGHYQVIQISPSESINTLYPDQSQKADSLYFEMIFPFMASEEEGGRRDAGMLDLQLAARYDRYQTKGAQTVSAGTPVARAINSVSSLDPTIAVRFQPIPHLMLRSSYGTGFKPPSVDQLVP